MRLRQVVIAARDLETTIASLSALFGIEVSLRDPGVAEFGLVNAVMPVGDTFLEVVSPVTPTASAQRFLDRRGDGGYMVMLQSARLDDDRRRLAELGVRVVWQMDLDDIRGTHLHPADVGGAILSLDEPRPPESWRWAGPSWERHVRTELVRAVAAVDLAAADPEALAHRWSRVLALPVTRTSSTSREIRLDPGTLRFAHGDGDSAPHIVGYEIAVTDRGRVLDRARAHGLPVADDAVTIAGTRLRLV
jgi:catechol 2,3-dioxygenase-like lactoylglutathione lyase family enzyme